MFCVDFEKKFEKNMKKKQESWLYNTGKTSNLKVFNNDFTNYIVSTQGSIIKHFQKKDLN